MKAKAQVDDPQGLTCTDCWDEICPIDDGGDIAGAAARQLQGHARGASNRQTGHLCKLWPLPHPE